MSNIKKPPTQRQLQVGEELRHALADVLAREDFYDPETREELEVTVAEVSISPDLRNATVFVIPLAGKNQERTMQLLKRIAPRLRALVSKRVRMRFMPDFYFKLDNTFDRVSALDEIFNRPDVRRDLEKENSEGE